MTPNVIAARWNTDMMEAFICLSLRTDGPDWRVRKRLFFAGV